MERRTNRVMHGWNMILCCVLFLSLGRIAFGEPVTITVSTWWMLAGNLGDLTNELVDSFEANHPDVNVEILNLDYGVDQLIVRHAAGVAPDVMFSDQWWFPDLASNGIVAPVDQYMEREGMSTDGFWPGVMRSWQAWWQGNATYGFPLFSVGYGLIADPAKFEEAGLEVTNDWDTGTFVDTVKRLTRDNSGDGEIDHWAMQGWGAGLMTMFWNYGNEILSSDGRKLQLGSPGGIEAARFIKDLSEVYHVITSSGTAFVEGRAAMLAGDTGIVNRLPPEREYTLLRWPKANTQITYMLSHAFLMSSTTEHKEEAWAFVKWMGSVEAQSIIVRYGIAPGSNDPWLVNLFINEALRSNVRDGSAALPASGMEDRADPVFGNWQTVKEEWHSIVNRAMNGEVDLVTGLREKEITWQGYLNQFWSQIAPR